MIEMIIKLSLIIIVAAFIVGVILFFFIGTPYYLSRIAKILENKRGEENGKIH